MGDNATRKDESRARLLAAAGRGFRGAGYGGIGVDGLAREAGATSGAFYAYFPSKQAAFRAAVEAGLEELREGVVRIKREHGPAWRAAFVDFYLGDRRTCAMEEGCALQLFLSDVARADAETRKAFERGFAAVVDAAADDAGEDARNAAIALLSMLVGAVSIARAMEKPAAGAKVAKGVRSAALATGGARRQGARRPS